MRMKLEILEKRNILRDKISSIWEPEASIIFSTRLGQAWDGKVSQAGENSNCRDTCDNLSRTPCTSLIIFRAFGLSSAYDESVRFRLKLEAAMALDGSSRSNRKKMLERVHRKGHFQALHCLYSVWRRVKCYAMRVNETLFEPVMIHAVQWIVVSHVIVM